jgi:hypothetical protein
MPELFTQPSSRIVQIDGEHALCEDGSVWLQQDNRQVPYMWVLASPPHKPTTQLDDLGEALAVLRMLAEYACIDHGKNQSQCLKAFDRAWETLRKHGA